MRETRAQSRMCTRASHGRGAAATVCAGWECWRWYGGGSVGALAWSLCSLSLSLCSLSLSLLVHFAPFLSFSLFLSLFCSLFSPFLVCSPEQSPFLLSRSNSPHLSAPCPGFSIHFSFCLQNPRWVSPSLPEGTLTLSLSLSLQKTRHSSSHFPFALFPFLLVETPRLYF